MKNSFWEKSVSKFVYRQNICLKKRLLDLFVCLFVLIYFSSFIHLFVFLSVGSMQGHYWLKSLGGFGGQILVHLSSDLFLLVVYGYYYFDTFSVFFFFWGGGLLLLDDVCVCDFFYFFFWGGGGVHIGWTVLLESFINDAVYHLQNSSDQGSIADHLHRPVFSHFPDWALQGPEHSYLILFLSELHKDQGIHLWFSSCLSCTRTRASISDSLPFWAAQGPGHSHPILFTSHPLTTHLCWCVWRRVSDILLHEEVKDAKVSCHKTAVYSTLVSGLLWWPWE